MFLVINIKESIMNIYLKQIDKDKVKKEREKCRSLMRSINIFLVLSG